MMTPINGKPGTSQISSNITYASKVENRELSRLLVPFQLFSPNQSSFAESDVCAA
jgi:hypothetical protein